MNNNLLDALIALGINREAAEQLMKQSEDVNGEIVGQDMIRRQRPNVVENAINTDGLQNKNLVTDGGQRVQVSARTLTAIAENILASEAMQNMIETVELLNRQYSTKITDLENQLLKMKERLSLVERNEDERLSEKIAEMPANNVLVLDIPNGYEASSGHNQRYDIVQMNGQQRGGVNTIHEVNGLFQKMRKDLKMGGGK